MGERVAESECNTPCQDGADGTASGNGTPQPNGFSGDTAMCGGPWRNSVYQQSTTNWEKAGYNDGGWQAAADLGPNGIAPWFHRQGIADTARWIWTADAGENGGFRGGGGWHQDVAGTTSGSGEGHDNIFCRFTQPNQEINCNAAQAKYLEDNRDVKDMLWPAWLHFNDVGQAEGRSWPSELCNTCTEASQQGTGGNNRGGITTNCDASICKCSRSLCVFFRRSSRKRLHRTHPGTIAAASSWAGVAAKHQKV